MLSFVALTYGKLLSHVGVLLLLFGLSF